MRLYTRTPAGIGLCLDILPTGQYKSGGNGGKLREVEVSLPIGSHWVVGYTVQQLPKTADNRPLLWADPGDLCADNGTPLTHEELIAELTRVNEATHAVMLSQRPTATPPRAEPRSSSIPFEPSTIGQSDSYRCTVPMCGESGVCAACRARGAR